MDNYNIRKTLLRAMMLNLNNTCSMWNSCTEISKTHFQQSTSSIPPHTFPSKKKQHTQLSTASPEHSDVYTCTSHKRLLYPMPPEYSDAYKSASLTPHKPQSNPTQTQRIRQILDSNTETSTSDMTPESQKIKISNAQSLPHKKSTLHMSPEYSDSTEDTSHQSEKKNTMRKLFPDTPKSSAVDKSATSQNANIPKITITSQNRLLFPVTPENSAAYEKTLSSSDTPNPKYKKHSKKQILDITPEHSAMYEDSQTSIPPHTLTLPTLQCRNQETHNTKEKQTSLPLVPLHQFAEESENNYRRRRQSLSLTTYFEFITISANLEK